MKTENIISLKLGNKIIFQHSLSQLSQLKKNKNIISNNIEALNKDVIPKFILDKENLENNSEKRMINEMRLFKKIESGYFIDEYKSSFGEEISKIEYEINNLQQSVEKNQLNDYIKFKEMISKLNLKEININKYKNLSNAPKKEILNLIKSNKKLYSNILCLNKNNIDKINGNLTLFKENIINKIHINNNLKRNKTEPNKIGYQKINGINKIKEEYLENFKNFIGNFKLSDRIIISYFDINHPNIKVAAKKYFQSKYGVDEITLIYIYKENQNDKIYHKFELVSEVNELFLAAKTENINNPKLYLKTGKEIINNRKIKCIGALNLDNNSIIFIN